MTPALTSKVQPVKFNQCTQKLSVSFFKKNNKKGCSQSFEKLLYYAIISRLLLSNPPTQREEFVSFPLLLLFGDIFKRILLKTGKYASCLLPRKLQKNCWENMTWKQSATFSLNNGKQDGGAGERFIIFFFLLSNLREPCPFLPPACFALF